MLSALLGSQNAEKVLLFLLVNESCYATELQKIYGIPLTPLQSILNKFEKIDVLLSEQRGKIKLYRFNPSYPFLEEVKALVKKAFLHLSPEEKRVVLSRKEEKQLPSKNHFAVKKQKALFLAACWERLSNVHRVSIQTQSGLQGFGEVEVKLRNETLTFTEKGHWIYPNSKELDFSNALRWTIDHGSQMIALEHLRHGPTRPVFLFHLAPQGKKRLQSIDSHLCRDDCYFGRLELHPRHIRLVCRILGPRKNETLYYTYETS